MEKEISSPEELEDLEELEEDSGDEEELEEDEETEEEDSEEIEGEESEDDEVEEESEEESEEEDEEEVEEESQEAAEEPTPQLNEGDDVILPQLVNFLTPIILLYALFMLISVLSEGFFPAIYAALISLAGLLLFSSKTSYKKLLSHLNFRLLYAVFLLCFLACTISVLLLISDFLIL